MNGSPSSPAAALDPWLGLGVRATFSGFVLAATWYALGRELFIRMGSGYRPDEGLYLAVPIVGLLAFSLKNRVSNALVAHLVAYARTSLSVFSGIMGLAWVFDRSANRGEYWGILVMASLLVAVAVSAVAALLALTLRWWERRGGRPLSLRRTILGPSLLLYAAVTLYFVLTQPMALDAAGQDSLLVGVMLAASSLTSDFALKAAVILLAPSVFAVYWLSLRTIVRSRRRGTSPDDSGSPG